MNIFLPCRAFAQIACVVTTAGLPLSTVAQNAPRELLTFRSTVTGAAPNALPDQWKVRAVRGQHSPEHTVITAPGETYLHIEGQGRAAWFVHELETPIAPGAGTVRWSWRVTQAPAAADLRRAASDDAAVRLFVVFRRDGFFDRTPHTVFYSTGGPEAAGYARPSFQSADLHVVRLDGDVPSTVWQCTVVDPFADYRRLWGEPARDIVAVGVLQDTDQTRGFASADVRTITWRPHDASPCPTADPAS